MGGCQLCCGGRGPACRGQVIAVGTTSVRVLEGAAQAHGGVPAYTGPVDLVIQPGYQFKVIQALLTNFHLPKSSLLLLVSALIGRENYLRCTAKPSNGTIDFSWRRCHADCCGGCAARCSAASIKRRQPRDCERINM